MGLLLGLSVPALVLSLLLGLGLGLGLFTFHFARGGSYFSNDPTACVNCHIMREQFDGWQKASHHTVATCNDCHAPHDFVGKYLTKAENGFWHSKAFTFQDFAEPIRIRARNAEVTNNACIYCHQELVSEVVGHGQSTLRCVHCHAGVGHGTPR